MDGMRWWEAGAAGRSGRGWVAGVLLRLLTWGGGVVVPQRRELRQALGLAQERLLADPRAVDAGWFGPRDWRVRAAEGWASGWRRGLWVLTVGGMMESLNDGLVVGDGSGHCLLLGLRHGHVGKRGWRSNVLR